MVASGLLHCFLSFNLRRSKCNANARAKSDNDDDLRLPHPSNQRAAAMPCRHWLWGSWSCPRCSSSRSRRGSTSSPRRTGCHMSHRPQRKVAKLTSFLSAVAQIGSTPSLTINNKNIVTPCIITLLPSATRTCGRLFSHHQCWRMPDSCQSSCVPHYHRTGYQLYHGPRGTDLHIYTILCFYLESIHARMWV